MKKRATNHTLIIGWGNDLRGDDAAGREAARRIAGEDWPGVDVVELHQLTPECALRLADYGQVLFIDAQPAGVAPEVTVRAIAAPAALPARHSVHRVTPEYLLALAAGLYGAHPRAWLVGIPAHDFDVGETLSAATRAGVCAALEACRQRVGPGAPPDRVLEPEMERKAS